MKKLAIFFIDFYQKYISANTPAVCRYTPSCSTYMKEAILKYGFWKGFKLGVSRIGRCNPKGGTGFDPVP